MIVSHASGFVFMHNPKVAGSSVRQVLGRFADAGTTFWGPDPDPTSPLHRVDRAHLGIEEFARLYPQEWARARGLRFHALFRAPRDRILSSVNEYSRHFASTDTRFLDPAGRRDLLFRTLERLRGLGRAEDVMDHYELTHFRPQWIYCRADGLPLEERPGVRCYPVADTDRLLADVGRLAGVPDLALETRANTSEQISLPGGVARLAADNRLRRRVTQAPVLRRVTPHLRRALVSRQAQQGSRDGFGLSVEDRAEVDDFVRHFYAEDLARLPLDEPGPGAATGGD